MNEENTKEPVAKYGRTSTRNQEKSGSIKNQEIEHI